MEPIVNLYAVRYSKDGKAYATIWVTAASFASAEEKAGASFKVKGLDCEPTAMLQSIDFIATNERALAVDGKDFALLA